MSTFIIALGMVASLIAWELWCLTYNIFFHPLKNFPGPWWAGASHLAEMYHDVILGGRFFIQVEKMHMRYGPMVRIGPNELSFTEPDFAERLYGSIGERRDRDERSARVSGLPYSLIATVPHDLHRIRREAMSGFFSKQAITKLEGLIWDKIDLFTKKLKHAQKQGKVLQSLDVYGAITTDIISEYAYGESFEYLDDGPDFKNDYLRNVSGLLFAGPLMKNLPFFAGIMMSLPYSVLAFLDRRMASIVELQRLSAGYARKAITNRIEVQKGDASNARTIFQALANSTLPPFERSVARIADEGVFVMVAGLETSARFLTNLTCHLLLNPDILAKLRAELKTVMPRTDSHPSWNTLENLPYLSAVIHEGLRCERITMFRNPRVIRESVQYKDWVIPPNTSLAVVPSVLNNNADVFPDPQVFRPERWIEAKARGQNLTRQLATFARGPRMCLGRNLALAELYLVTAAVVRGFDMELVDSGLEDILPYRDFTFSFTKDYSFGIKIRVTKALDE